MMKIFMSEQETSTVAVFPLTGATLTSSPPKVVTCFSLQPFTSSGNLGNFVRCNRSIEEGDLILTSAVKVMMKF